MARYTLFELPDAITRRVFGSAPLDRSVRFGERAKNPYDPAFDGKAISSDATSWQVWYYAVEAVDPQALKARVPESFHGLLGGRDVCPRCGKALACAPGADRLRMYVACPACGRGWQAVDAREAERAAKWPDWRKARGLPRTLSEAWAMKARELEVGERGAINRMVCPLAGGERSGDVGLAFVD